MTPTNPHVTWRLALAEEIAGRLAAVDGVRAVVVGGSVGRGLADRYSDLEMLIFWDTLPPDEVRQTFIADLGGVFFRPYDGPAREDMVLVEGFKVDFGHATVAAEEQVFDDVLLRFDTDPGRSNFMDTIRSCIPLVGVELIQRWKTKAQIYPDELAVRTIEAHLGCFDESQLTIHARRANPTMLYHTISELQQHVFMVLLSLNKQYFPTFKWLYPYLRQFAIKPDRAEARFRSAFGGDPAVAVETTLALAQDTLSLVQEHYPHIDTAAALQRLT